MHTKIYAILLINAILCNAAFGIDAQAAPNVAETANTPGPWNLGVDIGYTHFQDNLCCGNNTPTAKATINRRARPRVETSTVRANKRLQGWYLPPKNLLLSSICE